MAKATSISLKQFSQSVHTAVKAAAAKHPKFNKLEIPNNITVAYLIRGIPVPEAILKSVTVEEAQSFAADVVHSVAASHADLFAGGGRAAEGAMISIGGRLIIGFPPPPDLFEIGD